ncbi:hypothetical protein QP162_22000 [Sphingomonas aurantiaca]|uniref:hypothetical protein n=1 Tax=Sphingomonas aurantiaca TaxID=185949 RepID=UPI002FDF969E
MTSWREMATRALAMDADERPPAEYGLSPELTADLRRLQALLPPAKIANAAHWRPVVTDALRVAREGWAAKAIGLGWSVHDLFGVGPRDDWEFSGLAVWLAGRSLVSLNADYALAGGDDTLCSTFIRGGMGHGTHPNIAPVLLWEFGR